MDPRARQDAARATELLRAGQYLPASALLERVIKKSPRDPSLLHQRSIAQVQLGDPKGAIRSLQKALSIKPDSTLYLVDLAQCYLADARFDDAEKTLDKALRLDPNLAFAMGAKVELLQLTGAFEEARALAEKAIEAHPDDVRLAVAYAKLAPRIGAERQAVEIIDRILQTAPPPQPEARAFLLFRLVDLLDRRGEHDRAFETAGAANALVPARFDPAAHAASIDRMISAWTPERLATLPRATRETDLPILIVGMLRSGTSLVEQILAAHPRVFGADELTLIGNLCAGLTGPFATHEPRLEDPSVLTKAKLDQAQRQYLGALYTRGGKAARVTDKMPGNFAHLCLIDRMLPGARVIHCTRDPLDTAISCYFHHFQGAHPWCYRLEWIGAFQRDHDRLMRHWRSVLTDLPILTVPYEELVRDPDTWIPRLVEFTGLEWDDACLRPHESTRVSRTASNEQVRKPINTGAVARHTHYDAHLGPLRQALADPE